MKQVLISDKLTVEINFAGAEISSIKNKNGLEFIWQAKKEVWPRHAPVLFPIVGKLKDNQFIFKDKSYTLGQHGFARDHEFKLITANESHCVFELRSDANTKEIYPFDFFFQIKYELLGNKLITHYKVINPSEKTIFFSVGAHPGFKCPLAEGESFEDYFLKFESSDYQLTELNDGLRKESKTPLHLPTNKLTLSKELFNKDALVFENLQINTIALCSGKSAHKITMHCENWPYFGIWSKKGSDEFICLEPWYGIADLEASTHDLQKKDGILTLEAQKQFDCSFSVSFD